MLDETALEVGFECDCSDSDGEIVSALWEYGDGDKTDLPDQRHVYADPGSYRVRLTVEDDSGLRGYDQTVLVLAVGDKDPPTAGIQASTLEGAAQLSVTFVADVFDDDGSVIATAWDFQDEIFDEAIEVTRTYDEPGYYCVHLQAWDNDGLVANDQVTVTVRKGDIRPPRIVSEASTEVAVGTAYKYDADGLPSAQGSRPLFWRIGTVEDGVMVNADSAISCDPDTGAISWTPRRDQSGTHRLRLEVRNEAGVATQDVFLEIEPAADETPGAPDLGCGCGQSSSDMLLWIAMLPLWLRRKYAASRS